MVLKAYTTLQLYSANFKLHMRDFLRFLAKL